MPKSPLKSDIFTAALISEIAHDYPDFTIRPGRRFAWKPPRTIIYEQNGTYPPAYFALLTLHELGHAVLGHKHYSLAVDRLKIESAAWSEARRLFRSYQKRGILPESWSWDAGFVEDQLDTYRTWLHQKSLCKTCGLTRYQTPDGAWHCPRCDQIQAK